MFAAYDDDSDHWELEHLIASKDLEHNPRLWFGDGETNRTNDPRCQTEDLSDDAVRASDYGILNLQRELRALPEWTYQSSDIWNNNMSSVYKGIQQQFMRYTYHVMRHFGGVEYNYRTVDEPGDMYVRTSRSKQQQCMDFFRRHYLNEAPRWLIDQSYIRRLLPDPEGSLCAIGTKVLTDMLSTSRLYGLHQEFPIEEYLSTIESSLFSQSAPDQYHRALQRVYVCRLCELYVRSWNDGDDVVACALQHLRQLQRQLTGRSASAHYAQLADQIQHTLDNPAK